MATQRIFDNIMNEFNSDEEEENEENDMSKHSEEIKQHKKSSSLNENSNNQIKDKLFNTNREIVKKNQYKKRKRDEFGYFINNDEENNEENDENEEKSDSNENKEEESAKEEKNNNNNNDSIDSNDIKNENENSLNNSQNEEEEQEKDENNIDNNGNENEKEIDDNKDNNYEDNQENNENEVEQNDINDKENEVEENMENNEEQDDNEKENNFEENKENDVEQNDINENENNIVENKEKDIELYENIEDDINNNEDNINNDEALKENNNEKNEEQNTSNEKNENENEKEEENNLINELYDKNKTENLEQTDFENFRMGSFRPKPIPGSPKFSKRISKANEPKIENKEKKENKEKNSNYNLNNFTETIETTIEGDKVPIKESNNKNIPIYTHDNTFISLGKIPIKESFNNINNESSNKQSNKINEEKQNKNSKNEEKAEEDFLKREEIKRQKNKEENKNKNLEKINNQENKSPHKKEEEDGKENVVEDEEDKNINNKNTKIKKEVENIQNEIKEDSKEYIFSSINTLNNESIYLDQKSNNNNENDIKVISTKLLTDYQNAGNSQNDSIAHSHKNSGSKKNNNKNIVIQENKTLEPVNMGVNRNIFSKKLPSDRYLNKNNKKNNKNPMPVMNNVVYGSPSDKNFKNNNINYSIDQNKNLSTNNKDISPFNYNNISNQSKQIDSAKKKNELRKMRNKLYNDSIEKNFKKMDTQEKFTFKPQINQRSREISEQKLNDIKNNCNINENNNQKGTSLRLLLLYEDVNNKQAKLNQEQIKKNNDIISKANSKKINDVSYNMVNDRLNKKINNAITKFGKKEENKIVLNIVNMTQCLYELNIINELIKPKDNLQDINTNNQIDLSELQAMVDAIEIKDIKKLEEVELIEQLWYLLNPELKQSFDSEILCIFLKLFFCGNYTQKDLEKLIISLLDKYKINHKEKNEEEYQSPLRAKKYKINEIWSLDKFIKVFLTLKKNLKAYRENDYTKGDVYNNIRKENDKELTFEPNFVSNDYFYKYSQFQYNKDNSLIDLINKYKNKNQNSQKQKHDFNKVYERFKAEKERHDKTLQRIRKMQEEEELKMCTNVPKINKYVPKSRNEADFPSTEKKKKILDTEEKIYNMNKTNKKLPRYKLLYNLHQKYNKRDKIEKRIDKSDILDENCTFVPKISNIDIMNRTFSNIKKKKKPKGFNDYVNRNRSVLEKKEHEKKLEEDKRYGRNYDKIQKNKIKIKPLNITDLSKSTSKKKNNKQYIMNTDTTSKNRYNLDTEKNDNVIRDVYITLDIKTPSGTVKQLKIYNKNDKNTIEDINSFCKIYSLNDEIKRMLIKKAIQYKCSFFGKNIDNDRNNFLDHEDFDEIINKFRNDGNI